MCPKCGSELVTITSKPIAEKTGASKMGWLWFLVGKKKEAGPIKYKNQTIGICQMCGNKWKM